ncbi:MAG: Glu-tRNA(Gln) amidotransferase subunit GatD [Nitrososphaerota archaeon]|jgi:glutamyl-tRNA(Gln) amidotransferase subunit D|nr:Glu-tRNA(Gln) amidotransferase subunit GatD [Nitrososphaerota archaeon]
MCELEGLGYRGKALELLRGADCSVGDILEISSRGRVYEGILMPRFGAGAAIIVKLKSGYNIGIEVTDMVEIKRLGRGAKPAFVAPLLPKQNPALPHVVIMSTGGTIASRVDYRTGAVRSAMSANDLLGVVPELADIARVETEFVFSIYSEDFCQRDWSELALRVAKRVEEGVDGVVIAHGTDTMAYTSAALSFALQGLPVPVILVGAQRSSDRPSSDAATNLIGAVRAAGEAPFAGVGLAMHESISDAAIVVHRGTKVRKCHTSRRDTFQSVNGLPFAVVEDRVVMLSEHYQRRDPSRRLVLRQKFSDAVVLVKFYPGFDPSVIDFYVAQGMRGIVLEGSGLGHVSRVCFESIGRAIDRGVVVGLASQCVGGRVNMNVYDTGRDLLGLGVVAFEDMLAETGLVKLMWALGQTDDTRQVVELLRADVAGEYSCCTLLREGSLHYRGGL